MNRTKAFVRNVLPSPAFRFLKRIQRRIAFASQGSHSEEEHRILKYLESLAPASK
jgi:hypothetical protein